MNQVELSWFNPQPALLAWAKKNDILLEAYSPLGSSSQVRKGLEVPEVKEVAAELGITPAQVVLSWLHQRGVVVLPKSVNEARIQENFESAYFNLFSLSFFLVRVCNLADGYCISVIVFKLPKAAFEKIEKSATAHPQQRIIDPSPMWGVDIFEDDK